MPRRLNNDVPLYYFIMEKQATTTKQKASKIVKTIFAVLLVPIFFAAFMLDRVILVFLPHINGETIQESFKNLKHFVPIAYRVGFISVVVLFLQIWELLF